MKILLFLLMLTVSITGFAQASAPASFAKLEGLARSRVSGQARVSLAETVDIRNADPLESGRTPNYIRAAAANTKAAPQFGNLVQTFLFGGSVAPETKMAMGLRIAQIYESPYLFAHTSRWLRASEKGRALLAELRKGTATATSDALALEYAERLTNDIHGVTDERFSAMRGVFNDSQLIELTMTVSFFNHFVRFAEGTNLPVEDWVLSDESPRVPESVNKTTKPLARVALVSDTEIAQVQVVVENAKQAANQPASQGLGLGIANSQRAFLRVPALGQAWREFGFQNRQNWSIERNIQLQISFAVSMVNGCRYCTLHQVQGLRRLGVDPKKLLAMKKDDSALTPRELTAVEFARKLTTSPVSVTDDDFAKVKKEFGEQGAVEVVLQTGAFAFMNRFTDGLRLPSEDEAVKTYQEVYGDGTYEKWKF